MNISQTNSSPSSYEVGLLSYKIIGWVCVIFFAGCAIGAFMAKQYGPISIFAFFVLMGVYMIVAAGRFALDMQSIIHENIFGTFRISWNEIKQIEIGAADGTLVLHGENKRFVIAPPLCGQGRKSPQHLPSCRKKLKELVSLRIRAIQPLIKLTKMSVSKSNRSNPAVERDAAKARRPSLSR